MDCLVIGAGPAGLTGAVYLARFRRDVTVIDGGASRASWIPVSHNLVGFPQGLSGDALLQRLRAQAEQYGATILNGQVSSLILLADGTFEAIVDGSRSLRRTAHSLAPVGLGGWRLNGERK